MGLPAEGPEVLAASVLVLVPVGNARIRSEESSSDLEYGSTSTPPDLRFVPASTPSDLMVDSTSPLLSLPSYLCANSCPSASCNPNTAAFDAL